MCVCVCKSLSLSLSFSLSLSVRVSVSLCVSVRVSLCVFVCVCACVRVCVCASEWMCVIITSYATSKYLTCRVSILPNRKNVLIRRIFSAEEDAVDDLIIIICAMEIKYPLVALLSQESDHGHSSEASCSNVNANSPCLQILRNMRPKNKHRDPISLPLVNHYMNLWSKIQKDQIFST